MIRSTICYLENNGSWLMLCLMEQAFGIRGDAGDLLLSPHLTEAQLDDQGRTAIRCYFAGREIEAVYHLPAAAAGALRVRQAVLDGVRYGARIPRQAIIHSPTGKIEIELEGRKQ